MNRVGQNIFCPTFFGHRHTTVHSQLIIFFTDGRSINETFITFSRYSKDNFRNLILKATPFMAETIFGTLN